MEKRASKALERIKEKAEINAFIHVDEDGILSQAKTLDGDSASVSSSTKTTTPERTGESPPVRGMLLAIKDNIHVRGLPNSAGSPALRHFIPKEDNPVVARLRDAGALILGKSNMHELAFGITSNNTSFGPVRNPVDMSLISGGSSGGTAAAIAAGIVDAGLGTDTGGSIRIPASLTGVVGFRPTVDRYPSDGSVTPISNTRDTVGPMGKDVAHVIALDSTIMGVANGVDELNVADIRLGVVRDYFYGKLDPETREVAESALQKLRDAGVQILDVEFPVLADSVDWTSFPIGNYEAMEEIPKYLGKFKTGVSMDELMTQLASPDVAGIFKLISGDGAIPENVYHKALAERQTLITRFEEFIKSSQLDGIIFPTTILPARPIADSVENVSVDGEVMPTVPAYIHNSDPGSIIGIPGISLPAGRTDSGLPVGMEIDGPANSDRSLLAVALAVEGILLQ